jgi:hypothetical protein
MFGKINWKLWWAAFFGGAAFFPGLAWIVGVTAMGGLFFFFILIAVSLVVWNFADRDQKTA